jgi:hypothetical protein
MPTRLSSVAIRAGKQEAPRPAVLGPEIRDGKPPYGGQGRGEAGHGDLRWFCVAAAWRRRRKRCCIRRFDLIVERAWALRPRHRRGLVRPGLESVDPLENSRRFSRLGTTTGNAILAIMSSTSQSVGAQNTRIRRAGQSPHAIGSRIRDSPLGCIPLSMSCLVIPRQNVALRFSRIGRGRLLRVARFRTIPSCVR